MSASASPTSLSARLQPLLVSASRTLTAQVALLMLGLSLLTRLVLMAMSVHEAGAATWLAAFVLGLGSDLATLSLALLPVAVFDLLFPSRWPRMAVAVRGLAFAVIAFSLFFLLASEIIFWDEFGTRFNFIAVDYLVYTHEVIDNIKQSYPVVPLVGGFALAATALAWFRRAAWREAVAVPARTRLVLLTVLVVLASVLWPVWRVDSAALTGNHYADELAGNGLYSFFSAYRNNELDYARYYPVLPEPELREGMRALRLAPAYRENVASAGAAPLRVAYAAAGPALPATASPLPAVAMGAAPGPRKHLVMITVESLSADYLGTFGNTEGLTPQLDRLAGESLLFANLYATGTRTVRGLESLSLSVPPTPGQSIVRRPGNEELATLGEALNRSGYRSRFLYGGYGYFDNMNYYFSHNGYEVLDRNDIPARDIGFANAWGVSDEYLFNQALRTMDAEAGKQPQFLMLMTTSNHRPYTYPDGRIDTPSPGGRAGAVKYTDFAIGQFLAQAAKRPWFRDTVFVVVADHCASSAGKTSLPVNRYHIPAIVYAPGFIKPQREERMMSQIDLAPTLMGLLGLPADPHFFGKDVFHDTSFEPRALIANYQEVGLLKGDRLLVLAPRHAPRMFRVQNPGSAQELQTEVKPDPALVDEAITYYQSAAEAFRGGRMRLPAAQVAWRATPRS